MERAELANLAAATGCAEEIGSITFLRPRRQGDRDQAEFDRQTLLRDLRPGGDPRGWLCLPTGGSSGGLKFARHDETTLQAAVEGMQRHFGLERINAVDVLPAHHVSGFMARVRSAATRGTHLAWDWKRLEAADFPVLSARPDGWVLSLVPTQLQRLLAVDGAAAWLRGFRHVFLGGGPTWATLADAAVAAGLPVSLTYGMTETAAMVAAQLPGDFRGGDRTCGSVLPHARLRLDGDQVIHVGGRSVCRGYWPEWNPDAEFVSADLGEFDARGHLRVLGRRDAAVISGGEKVHPAEVELLLRNSGEFRDVAVVGIPDPEWGEVLVACYPRPEGRAPDLERAVSGLAPHQRPKRFLLLTSWPDLGAGKVNRARLQAAARAAVAEGS
ncbi:MAG: AMP-binding protein [Verrucomicrobia bacterium]|nr:AMP-binding protein [Verrucomicrobiota bacterium]